MDSFFFNITERRYKITDIFRSKEEYLRRVDISNGIVFVESKLCLKVHKPFHLKNLDRMVMIVMVKRGILLIEDHIEQKSEKVKESKIAIFCSSKQDLESACPEK